MSSIRMPRGRAALAAATAVAAAAIAPSAAQAAAVAVVGDHIEYRAAAGEVNQLDLGQSGATRYAISDRVSPLFAGPGCQPVNARRVQCSLIGVRFVSIEVGDGNDSVDSIGDLPGFETPSVQQVLVGGTGNDHLIAGTGQNTLDGQAGDDTLFGFTGNDNMNGREGNDTLLPGTGRDVAVGGTGRDRVSYANHSGPVIISVDGAANDGAAGEGDNVARDVEELEGSSGSDTLVGNELVNRFFGSPGNDLYIGGAGNDDYLASNDPGADTFQGGGGTVDAVSYNSRRESLAIALDGQANDGTSGQERDNIGTDVESASGGQAADFLFGNGANNRLFGSAGADVITGNGGADVVVAGLGDDRVFVKDGIADTVSCGGGTGDRVERDAGLDSISSTCETRV
jgi:Ca2+-binding RTX toxin-like protein